MAKEKQLKVEAGGEVSNPPQPDVAVKTPEMEMFEKVALMANLSSAVQNPGLKATISDLPDGERIYNLLVKAVHGEIQGIMGKSDKDVKEMSANMQQMAAAMGKFVQVINLFNDAKVVSVLGAIAQKLKPLGDLGEPQQFVQQHQQQVDNGHDQVNSNEQRYAGPGQRAPREPGLGSF